MACVNVPCVMNMEIYNVAIRSGTDRFSQTQINCSKPLWYAEIRAGVVVIILPSRQKNLLTKSARSLGITRCSGYPGKRSAYLVATPSSSSVEYNNIDNNNIAACTGESIWKHYVWVYALKNCLFSHTKKQPFNVEGFRAQKHDKKSSDQMPGLHIPTQPHTVYM